MYLYFTNVFNSNTSKQESNSDLKRAKLPTYLDFSQANNGKPAPEQEYCDQEKQNWIICLHFASSSTTVAMHEDWDVTGWILAPLSTEETALAAMKCPWHSVCLATF